MNPARAIARRVRAGWLLARAFGPGWVAFRVRYAARKKLGLLERRLPRSTWEDRPLASLLVESAPADPERLAERLRPRLASALPAPPPVEALRDRVRSWDAAASRDCVADVRRLEAGRPTYFSSDTAAAGYPPAWHRNAFTGETAPGVHWSRIGDFAQGDIKLIWEPSRFAFAFDLVRAAWRNGDEGAAERFWELVEDWRRSNPPQTGPAWMCGQETALRAVAMVFGLIRFLDAPATTAPRLASLVQTLALFASRIEGNLDYALSQRNNHGISEALGLWTVGVLLPELRGAATWKRLGRHALETQTASLFAEDGAFSQSSFNYQRLALHDLLWALVLAERLDEPLAPVVRERFAAGTALLDAVVDRVSGGAPRYGPSDGALVLPLDGCDHGDFRPVVQACRFQLDRRRRFADGPWDEPLLWLHGATALEAPPDPSVPDDLSAARSGYWTLRSESGFVFTRCGRFEARPGHADLLHADVWWRGRNVALDAGTYSYNAPPPWNDGGGSTALHNTVTVDGLDQMERRGRFLWLPWAHGRSAGTRRFPDAGAAVWEGRHDGYARLRPPAHHRRAIVALGADHWLILDRLEAGGTTREFRLHWLLADAPFDEEGGGSRLRFRHPEGEYRVAVGTGEPDPTFDTVRGDETSGRGWAFPYYHARVPAVSLSLRVRARRALFWTLLGPTSGEVRLERDAVRVVTGAWSGRLALEAAPAAPEWVRDVVRADGKDTAG